MTANPFAALLDGVPRYGVNVVSAKMERHPYGVYVELDRVLAALAAAMDPAIVERAGNLLPDLQKAMVPYDPEVDAQEYWETLCSLSADLITALLVQNAAQEAQIKGLEERLAQADVVIQKANEHLASAVASRDKAWYRADNLDADVAKLEDQIEALMNGTSAASQMALDYIARAETAETALAAMTKERDLFRDAAASAANDHVAQHKMRVAAETALAAERAKVAKLVEAGKALQADMLERARIGTDAIHGEEYRIVNAGRTAWADFCAAITEAGQ